MYQQSFKIDKRPFLIYGYGDYLIYNELDGSQIDWQLKVTGKFDYGLQLGDDLSYFLHFMLVNSQLVLSNFKVSTGVLKD